MDPLQEIEEVVDTITDGLGLPIDAGIKKTVAALQLCGFPTTASCEGHMKRALPFPWVDIGTDSREENIVLQCAIQFLIEKFYSTRERDLCAIQIGFSFGDDSFRIQSVNESNGHFGVHNMDTMIRDQEILNRLREEMNEFAKFLVLFDSQTRELSQS